MSTQESDGFPVLSERLSSFIAEFEPRFARYLRPTDEVPIELQGAVNYSALSPGKRLRPFLVVRSCELVGGSSKDAWAAAAAVECIHAFSLVHDDLPAMDNDDFRRGRPTTHKEFDEATAILAGDALAVLPFELVAAKLRDARKVKKITLELARATGWSGMIGGQSADLTGETIPADLYVARYIHERKTARLFAAACRIGAICGGGSEAAVSSLGDYGRHVGLAFQIADDLLDVTASRTGLGKEVGKDAAAGKQSFPRCVGMVASRRMAAESVAAAVGSLSGFGDEADDLRQLARFVVDRSY